MPEFIDWSNIGLTMEISIVYLERGIFGEIWFIAICQEVFLAMCLFFSKSVGCCWNGKALTKSARKLATISRS